MIPRILHHIWVGDPMPAHLEAYRQTWLDLHPDWEHRLWGERELTWLQNQELFDNARDYTRHTGQFRADVARYEILRLLGGVYVDCDMECRRPLDDLLDGVDCFAAWETEPTWINNAVLGSTPGHPLMVDLVDLLPARVAATHGKRPNVMSGPQFLTPVAQRHDVTVFPQSHFYPYRWDELERGGEAFPDAYAVHHWENARKRRGVARV